MRSVSGFAASACLLVAGCGSGEHTTVADETLAYPFDSRPAEGREIPKLEGAGGRLRYHEGCLYLEERSRGRVGLIMPDSYGLDGRTLSDGQVAFEIGSRVSFSGGWVSADKENYACKDMSMLVVDSAFAGPPPEAR